MAMAKSLKPLIVKQKQANRLIDNIRLNAHTRDIFVKLKILPFEKQVLLERQKFMYLFYHKKQPLSFSGLWLLNEERNPNIELRSGKNYYVPAHRLELMKRSPLVAFACAWNQAKEVKLNTTLRNFLKQQKQALLDSI